MDSATASRDRIWFAQLLRGPACLLVVYAHLGGIYLTAQPIAASVSHFEPVAGLPTAPWRAVDRALEARGVSAAALGVCVFFLVSGFVIPFSLQRVGTRAFFVRRVLRLYPTLWACIAVTATAVALISHSEGLPRPFGPSVIATNALLIAPYVNHPWIEPASWTLAVEELFYATAAIMAARGVLARAEWVIASAVVATVISTTDPSHSGSAAAYTLASNLTFLPLIFIGTASHFVWTGRWSRARGVIVGAVLFGLFVTSLFAGPHGYQARVYATAALLAIAVFTGGAALGPRLSYSRGLDAISSVSYPLYLLHATNGYIVLHWLHNRGVSYFAALPIAVLLAVLGAILVHRVVEVPSQQLGRRLTANAAERRTSVDVKTNARP